jgi:hypothetical protein
MKLLPTLFRNKGDIGYWILRSYLAPVLLDIREIQVEVDLRKSLVVKDLTEANLF